MKYDITFNKNGKTSYVGHHVLLTILVSFLLLMPSITIVVRATDIIVDDDGTGDYTSIQDAINAASPGDTIWVKQGSYNSALTVNLNNISILADNGAEPILYLTSYSPGIDIQSSNILIEGFKIYGNTVPSGGPSIRVSAAADKTTIRENNFKVISGETGNSALLIESGAEEITFQSNSVDGYERGVELEDNTQCKILSNTFYNVNQSVYHGANIEGSSDWYGTIQDAIDIANIDDSLFIVPGLFTENLQVNKSLTLNGANNGVNPNSGARDEETIIDGDTTSPIRILQETADVMIDGLTLKISNKSPASNEAGVLIEPGTDTIFIKNTIFEDITDGGGADTTSDESYAVMIYGRDDTIGGQKNITITDNLIHNVEEYGIAINDNTSFVTITGNTITNLISSDHSADPIWDATWPDIICSAIHMGGQVGPITNITISDNILMTEVMGDGVATAAGSGISFAGVAEWLPPNRVWRGFEEIYISNNKIVNNSMGVIALAGNTTNEITIHNKINIKSGNNFSNNSLFGIHNLINDIYFNATNNWWGDISGPYNITENDGGIGVEVDGNVTFWPWLEFGTEKNGYSIIPFVEYQVELPNINDGEIVTVTTEIEIDAEDNESGLLSLTYRVWNTTHRWGPWINYTDAFTLSGEGIHRVQYNATDNAGASAYTDMTGSFSPYIYKEHRVDSIAPTVDVIYPNGDEFEFGTIPIQWSAEDKIFDQGQLDENNSLTITEDYPGHIQSFIPAEDSINSVQLFISGDEADVSVKLFDEIYPVPSVIGQSVQHIENIGAPVWVDFAFSDSIDLELDDTYYIGVTQSITGDTGFRWYYFDDASIDGYPYGHAWFKETDALVNESGIDFAFKTMYWKQDLDISIKYSNTGVSPWSTIAEFEENDGYFEWDTASYGIPDGANYRIRIEAYDKINNVGFDSSDEKFIIDNDGPGIYNINITDTTISDSTFTKNGDSIEILANVVGDPIAITADLSGFGKGTEVEYTTFTGGIARWTVDNILCVPSDGPVAITITATDATGDVGSNSASVIADNTAPEIIITKPRAGLYLMDSMRLLPFSYPFIIGQITFESDANDDGSGVESVEFYLENELEAMVSEPPYHWLWDRAATGFFDVEIVVKDNVGHEAFDEINDLFIINFDIIGHN